MADFCHRVLLTVTLLVVSGYSIRADGYSETVIDKSTEIARQHTENIRRDIQKRMHKALDEVTAIIQLLDNQQQYRTEMKVLQETQLREKLPQMKRTLHLQLLPTRKLHSGQYCLLIRQVQNQ